MRARYVIGVLIAITVLGVNQAFIQYSLHQKKQDAFVINIAGRQRMLSQRINLELYKLKNGKQSKELLYSLIDLWQSSHETLLHGDPKVEIAPIEAEDARIKLNELTPSIQLMSDLLTNSNPAEGSQLAMVDHTMQAYLVKMDETVKLLELEADRKLNNVIWIEIILALVSILVISLEVFFIYLPIEAKLKKKIAQQEKTQSELIEHNKRLQAIAQIQSHEVRRPLANILGLIELIKEEEEEEHLEVFLEQLKESGQQLDEIIHEVVRQTNIKLVKSAAHNIS